MWAVAGFGRFFIDLSFLREQSPWSFSGLDSCVLAYCGSAAPLLSLQPLYNYARGARSSGFFSADSSDQCRTVKLGLPAVRELFWGMLGKGAGGWKGIGVSGSGYNEVLTLEVRNEVWLRRTKKTCTASSLYNGSSRVCWRAVVLGVLACVHMYILHVCVYICVCVYVCGHVYMYIYACICICTPMRLYTCVCVCVCIFVHRLWVLVSVFQRVDGVMHAHVFSCAYACVYVCV